jgi:hypothetical protein
LRDLSRETTQCPSLKIYLVRRIPSGYVLKSSASFPTSPNVTEDKSKIQYISLKQWHTLKRLVGVHPTSLSCLEICVRWWAMYSLPDRSCTVTTSQLVITILGYGDMCPSFNRSTRASTSSYYSFDASPSMFYKTALQERKQKRKLAHVDAICVTTDRLVLRIRRPKSSCSIETSPSSWFDG